MTTPLSSIPWTDVIAVGIRTTADGPFCEDVFWHFLLRDHRLQVPGGLIDDVAFDVLRERCPGLDWSKVVQAMGCSEERIFRVWHHEDSRRVPSRDDLAARYVSLVERLGGTATTHATFDRLYESWSAESRRYHGIEHLVDCLRELDAADAGAFVELALWYHDVVYEPMRHDSEERSAQALLADAADLGIPLEVALTVADLIRATAHADGSEAPSSSERDLVVDIDLSILGRDALRFMEFEYGVEEEYAHVSTLTFRRARGRFLAGLLARPRLFRTEGFRKRYEQRARAQIADLLASPRYRAFRWLRWLP